MDTMLGRTVGLVGYGSIGQSTAKMAKTAFGCKIVALRRQADAGDPTGIADEVLGFDDRQRLFAESDFIVCSLPKVCGGSRRAPRSRLRPAACVITGRSAR